MLTYDFRLPPGPRTVEYALLAENLGFRAVLSLKDFALQTVIFRLSYRSTLCCNRRGPTTRQAAGRGSAAPAHQQRRVLGKYLIS